MDRPMKMARIQMVDKWLVDHQGQLLRSFAARETPTHQILPLQSLQTMSPDCHMLPVDTRDDYAKGLSSYYEIVVAATGTKISVCLARNDQTVGSPFISGIEIMSFADSLYNTTDFTQYALSSVARHSFGHEDEIISYPDDQFNRYWQPFKDENPIVQSKSVVSAFDFWNLPPATVFNNAITTSRGKTLTVNWPAFSLPSGNYFVSLYFQDPRTPSPYSWRNFDV